MKKFFEVEQGVLSFGSMNPSRVAEENTFEREYRETFEREYRETIEPIM